MLQREGSHCPSGLFPDRERRESEVEHDCSFEGCEIILKRSGKQVSRCFSRQLVGRYDASGKAVVVKRTDEVDSLSLRKEFEVLRALSHPSIVRAHVLTSTALCLESFDSDLFSQLQLSFPRVQYAFVRKVFLQVLAAVDYLHGVAGRGHFDIKPENIVLRGERAALIDFEYAERFSDINQGTAGAMWSKRSCTYLPPEVCQLIRMVDAKSPVQVYQQEIIDWRKIDVFSLGVVLHTSVFYTLPFEKGSASVKDPLYGLLYEQ